MDGYKEAKTAVPGEIAADVLYTIKEASRRLDWGRKTMQRAQREGLRTVQFGRGKYVRGAEVIRFIEEKESSN